jgi:hypothetical protein
MCSTWEGGEKKDMRIWTFKELAFEYPIGCGGWSMETFKSFRGQNTVVYLLQV